MRPVARIRGSPARPVRPLTRERGERWWLRGRPGGAVTVAPMVAHSKAPVTSGTVLGETAAGTQRDTSLDGRERRQVRIPVRSDVRCREKRCGAAPSSPRGHGSIRTVDPGESADQRPADRKCPYPVAFRLTGDIVRGAGAPSRCVFGNSPAAGEGSVAGGTPPSCGTPFLL